MTRALRWLPALLIAGLLVYFSSRSPAELPGPSLAGGLDKVAHFVAYAALALAVRLAWRPRTLWPVVVVVGLFGGSDELHQGLTPGRDPSGWDLVADVGGAATAMLVFGRMNRTAAAAV